MRRSKGSGHVYKKNGHLYVRHRSNGVDINKPGGKNLMSAEKQLNQIKHHHCINREASQRFSEFIERWIKICTNNKSESTVISYKSQIEKHILPALGGMRLSEIKATHLTSFYNDLFNKGLCPKSIQRINAIISAIFNQAIRFEIVVFNPTVPAVKPRKENKNAMILSKEKFDKFIDLAMESPFKFPALFQALLGLRPGESLGVSWDSIDLQQMTLDVKQQILQTTTNGRPSPVKTECSLRRWMIPNLIYQELIKVPASDRRGLVLPKKYRRYQKYLRWIKKAGCLIGEKRLTPHCLRHTQISYLLHLGADLATMSKKSGHSTITVTADTYAHHVPGESEKKMLEAINELTRKEQHHDHCS